MTAFASTLGLAADRTLVLHDSNKLTLRVLPADLVAPIGPEDEFDATFELDITRQLGDHGAPVVAPDPRVEPRPYRRAGFTVSWWTHHGDAGPIPPETYARALRRMHAGLRSMQVAAPGVGDRIAEAQELVADRDRTLALKEPDRSLSADVLTTWSRPGAGTPPTGCRTDPGSVWCGSTSCASRSSGPGRSAPLSAVRAAALPR